MLFEHFLPAAVPKYLASKWIHLPFLIARSDWEQFFKEAGDIYLVRASGVYLEQDIILSVDQFLESWDRYLVDLVTCAIADSVYKPLFSLYVTLNPKTVGMVDALDGRVSATQITPNIIFQSHRFQYSTFDKQYRRQVFGPGAISWGVQASFPTLVQDSRTRVVQKALLSTEVVNRPLWMLFQKWLKNTTIPVTLKTEDGVKTVPFRISNSCKAFIDRHFELNQKGIKVVSWSQ